MLQIFAQGDCDGSEVMIDPRFPDVGRPTFQDMRSLDEEFVVVRARSAGRAAEEAQRADVDRGRDLNAKQP
jgi:hypothetical protein